MKRTILELQPDEKKLLGDLPDGTQGDLCMKQPLAAVMWSRQYVLQNFHRAMEEGWIQVYFQPVIRSVTGMMCGAEALCRWIDPDRGMITPDQFIPVLEEQGLIYTLDLYVVEQVCRGYRDLVKRNVPLIPVSVNLSRVDFRHPDLVERIDALARQYQVPREILNIEITESAFPNQTEELGRFICRFHEKGFRVWLDDFGTAYSSLAALKDLPFDELKLDMNFLSTGTEKARTIISSVVRMAKSIGISTLAEGVETEEQYRFLRKIGCEKIQGYYFGHPMKPEEFERCVRKGDLKPEPLRLGAYYAALGRVDYQTEHTLCVLEDDGINFKLIFMNDAYRRVLARDGVLDGEGWIDTINIPNNPSHAFHRAYVNEQLRKKPGEHRILYPSGDHYMELVGKTIAQHENDYIYTLRIRYISLNPNQQEQKLADGLSNLYYFCEDIILIDLERSTAYGLKSSNSDQPIGSGNVEVNLHDALEVYGADFIYGPDLERYLRFTEVGSLRRRILENRRHMLSELLRIRDDRGEYRWKLILLLPVPKTDGKQVMSISLAPDLSPETLCELVSCLAVQGAEAGEEDDGGISSSLLWENVERFGDDMYFWKDQSRRFLGATNSFLDFYGLDSLEEIRGKTDEDMGWHKEVDPFRRDELRVLQKGDRVRLALGKCIVHGKQRTILASKIPIYRNGRIVGLVGKFSDAEQLRNILEQKNSAVFVDPVTGLSNNRGLVDGFRSYLEELWNRGTEFAVIQMENIEFPLFRKNYGEEAGNRILRHVADILRDIAGRSCVIGRLSGSVFCMLVQYQDPEEVAEIAAQIRERTGGIQIVGNLQCACTQNLRISYLNPENASREWYADVTFRVVEMMMNPEEK